MSDLPDGITFNEKLEDKEEVVLPFDSIEIWNCPNCELVLEALIIGKNGRYEGKIKVGGFQATTWQGKLPKDEQKAKNYLKDTLQQKINRHKGMH